MRRRHFFILAIVAAAGLFCRAAWADEKIKDDFVGIELVFQHSAVAPDSNSAIQIKFSLEKDWHFYADQNTTPQGMSLKVIATGRGLIFGEPVFPAANLYFDKVTNKKLRVYSRSFSIFIPFTADANSTNSEIKIAVNGLACSQQLCNLAAYELNKKLEISASAMMDKPVFSIPVQKQGEMTKPESLQASAEFVLPLAIVAGLLLNIMPCVWPVLPIIVARLIQQAGQKRTKSVALAFAFAAGIVLFFVVLAAVNIILKISFGMVFQWGDQFRNPAFVTGMALLMVVLALYMFGLLTFGLPSSIGSRGGQGAGFAGSVGMGFLAAVLSTPCSFALLAFVLAWAQTQPIALATVTILLIGIGMALPYVILTSIPAMLAKIPKPGRWMELFKHATGFILLAIGVKLLEAVQAEKMINVLYYALVLAVCVWMWGGWVGYNTPKAKKWMTRLIAVALAVIFGFVFLAESEKGLINWQPYDAEVIASAEQAGEPVLIKFTADWCMSCKILDKTVYSSKQVADLIEQKGVLVIKADTTGYDYPATIALKENYDEPAVPVTVLLLPNEDAPVKLRGNMIKVKLIKHLQGLKNAGK